MPNAAEADVVLDGKASTRREDRTVETARVEKADLQAIADEALTMWDQFVDEVASADLMYKSAPRNRGAFPVWKADGTRG